MKSSESSALMSAARAVAISASFSPVLTVCVYEFDNRSICQVSSATRVPDRVPSFAIGITEPASSRASGVLSIVYVGITNAPVRLTMTRRSATARAAMLSGTVIVSVVVVPSNSSIVQSSPSTGVPVISMVTDPATVVGPITDVSPVLLTCAVKSAPVVSTVSSALSAVAV